MYTITVSTPVTLTAYQDIIPLANGELLLCCHCDHEGYMSEEDIEWVNQQWKPEITKLVTCYPALNQNFPEDYFWEPIRDHQGVVHIDPTQEETMLSVSLLKGFYIELFKPKSKLILKRGNFRYLVNYEGRQPSNIVVRNLTSNKVKTFSEPAKVKSLYDRIYYFVKDVI